jgi:DNA invertase Pin-like site-specific DNA recombinase
MIEFKKPFENSPRPRAYSYVRMSTPQQLRGDSLRRQVQKSVKYAADHGLELVEEDQLKDIGLSGFDGANVKRGALGKFLEGIRDGSVKAGSYLLVEFLDRLSRQDVFNSLGIFIEILKGGISLVTLLDGKLYNQSTTDFSDMMLSLGVLARSKHRRERLAASWTNKRNNIVERKLTSQCPAWLKLCDDKTAFQVLEHRVTIIQSMFEDSAGGMGDYTITRRLNQQKIPTFGRSKGWQKIVCFKDTA